MGKGFRPTGLNLLQIGNLALVPQEGLRYIRDMNKPMILTDVDDVCLNYIEGFRIFAERVLGRKILGLPDQWDMSNWLGLNSEQEATDLVHQFNHGEPEFGMLPPLAEAEKYIPQLSKHCNIVAITCCSTDPTPVALRNKNLERVFGKGVFSEVICQPLGTRKVHNLSIFKDCNVIAWVEDKAEAAVDGASMGYRSFLMEQSHNKKYRDENTNSPLVFVKSWKDIANVICF
jgi:hypothetical protein